MFLVPKKPMSEIILVTISSIIFSVITNLLIMINSDVLISISVIVLAAGGVLFVIYVFMKKKIDDDSDEKIQNKENQKGHRLLLYEINQLKEGVYSKYRWKDSLFRVLIFSCLAVSVILIVYTNIEKQKNVTANEISTKAKDSTLQVFAERQLGLDTLIIVKLNSIHQVNGKRK